MKNERKFLFKRRTKLLFMSGIILLGFSLILWFFVNDNAVDIPSEEIKQDTNPSPKIPLKNTSPSKEIIPSKESNSQNSNSISSSHPKVITEITSPVISKLPPDSQFKGSPTTTTNPIKIKNYKTFNLTLRNETRSPDGFSRYVYTINNQFPGPEIIVDKGDTIRINVTNYIGHPTTIHVHGMVHMELMHMDGVPYATQCPIQNGSSFTYEFEATHPGTYW